MLLLLQAREEMIQNHIRSLSALPSPLARSRRCAPVVVFTTPCMDDFQQHIMTTGEHIPLVLLIIIIYYIIYVAECG